MERSRFRVVVVGAGSIGERHIRCFQRTDHSDVAFVEPRAELRAEIAARYPGATPLETVEQALGDPSDVAVIATPAPLHVAQALSFVRRGAHVLVEKPLAVTPEGVDQLTAAALKANRVVGVAYVYRAHPVLADMRAAIASGRFGRPVELVAVCGQHFPLYRPAFRETYYATHASGGGAIQDALTHIVNAGQWLVGPVQRLAADAARCVLDGVEVEDTVHVLARHGALLANYSLNQHQAPNETAISVVCERGTARFEMHACRWREMTTPGGEWIDHSRPQLERDELFIRQAGSFLDAVESGGPPACTLADGLHTLHVNRAILASVTSGQWEQIPDVEP
ncbi:1,5-anhydro-D-fructose reductase [Caulifigura coniformis]|uniref:1,5-anhydro-D-fructose reductase n=1 Tax=Caulifigura coniformis TaxID=2527983 RepID=A0A517SJE3_9PLAN|nr:Gfo/Idh/MocA family oxidoreductase [Caulifigura coniformis]QDT56244.1 1,5-anhydro-D-fructose reductase [Caulifigura coniformis]